MYSIWNWFFFQTYRPHEPSQQSGLIYPFDIKGHPVFISAADLNFNAICVVLSIGFGLLFAIMVSVRTRTPWQTDDAANVSISQKLIVASFSITAVLLYLFGKKTADFLVIHNIIFRFWS